MNIREAKLPVCILSYSSASRSARALAEYINSQGVKCTIRAKDSPTKMVTCIRWGKSELSMPSGAPYLNHRAAIETALDKRRTFGAMQDNGVLHPEWTTAPAQAADWLLAGDMVVARHTLTSHSGQGIQIVTNDGIVYKDPSCTAPWQSAKLFTKYFKRTAEYRVFVVGGAAVLVYRKGASSEIPKESRQYYVRTHATGWNFCAVALSDVPAQVLEMGVRAAASIDIDVCAVDIGWHEPSSSVVVFEINSAPGIDGGTVPVIGEALLNTALRARAQGHNVGTSPLMEDVTLVELSREMQMWDAARLLAAP